jgi:NAD-dependent dihydropyrimidine dehydrogenase PreA subunit
MPGTFIDVELDDSIQADAELAKQLEEACPVDIFEARNGSVTIVEENLDECVLCELCVRAAPPGTLRVRKLYDGSALERGP